MVIIVNKLYEPNDEGKGREKKPAIRKMTHVLREVLQNIQLRCVTTEERNTRSTSWDANVCLLVMNELT